MSAQTFLDSLKAHQAYPIRPLCFQLVDKVVTAKEGKEQTSSETGERPLDQHEAGDP